MSNFKDDRHALYTGWVLGKLAKHSFRSTPMVDDEGDYVPSVAIEVGNETIVLDVPEPPDEWALS